MTRVELELADIERRELLAKHRREEAITDLEAEMGDEITVPVFIDGIPLEDFEDRHKDTMVRYLQWKLRRNIGRLLNRVGTA